jgi:hypothetical protein
LTIDGDAGPDQGRIVVLIEPNLGKHLGVLADPFEQGLAP